MVYRYYETGFFSSSSEDVVVNVDCQLVGIQSHLGDRPPDPPELWAASLPGADVLNSIWRRVWVEHQLLFCLLPDVIQYDQLPPASTIVISQMGWTVFSNCESQSTFLPWDAFPGYLVIVMRNAWNPSAKAMEEHSDLQSGAIAIRVHKTLAWITFSMSLKGMVHNMWLNLEVVEPSESGWSLKHVRSQGAWLYRRYWE